MDAVQEAVASTSWHSGGLVRLGKEELAYVTPLAQFAVPPCRRHRPHRWCSVNINDVTSPWCQRHRGICVESLNQQDAPARIARWLLRGPPRHAGRRCRDENRLRCMASQYAPAACAIAEALATGEGTTLVARRFGLTAGRISQLSASSIAVGACYKGKPTATVRWD